MKTILTEEDENEVTLCSDGQKAINIFRENTFDLIITDLIMPGANGLEVLKETRKIDPDIDTHFDREKPVMFRTLCACNQIF